MFNGRILIYCPHGRLTVLVREARPVVNCFASHVVAPLSPLVDVDLCARPAGSRIDHGVKFVYCASAGAATIRRRKSA